MNNRRLIEALLACGREIHPVPHEVRERIFTRVLAAAADEVSRRTRLRLQSPCRGCQRRRLQRRVASRYRAVRAHQVRYTPAVDELRLS